MQHDPNIGTQTSRMSEIIGKPLPKVDTTEDPADGMTSEMRHMLRELNPKTILHFNKDRSRKSLAKKNQWLSTKELEKEKIRVIHDFSQLRMGRRGIAGHVEEETTHEQYLHVFARRSP